MSCSPNCPNYRDSLGYLVREAARDGIVEVSAAGGDTAKTHLCREGCDARVYHGERHGAWSAATPEEALREAEERARKQ